MLTKALPKYEELPILTPTQINKTNGQILYYDELVINIKKFSHPGTKSILKPHLNTDISQIFHSKSHSNNAKLFLLNLTIGRTSSTQGRGHQLFKQVTQQKKYILHQKIMKDLDLSRGVLEQTRKFSVEEMEAFVTIPKFFQNSAAIMFTGSRFEEFWYQDRFWGTTTSFIVILASIMAYLIHNNSFFDTSFKYVLFILGIFLWTPIQYFYHRYLFHSPLTPNMTPNTHYIHHAFPNIKNKIALSVKKILTYELTLFSIFTYIFHLPSSPILHLLMGIHTMMTLYGCLHYYFHFGGERYLPGITELRRNHLKHHLRDAGRGFGVSCLVWDWVFGTRHVK